jgi:PAS domain S-box-containing protein
VGADGLRSLRLRALLADAAPDPVAAAILGLKQGATAGGFPDFRRTRLWILALYGFFSLTVAVFVAKVALAEREQRKADARAYTVGLARAYERQLAGFVGAASQYLVSTRDVIEDHRGLDAIAPERLDRALRSQLVGDLTLRRVVLVDARGVVRSGGATGADLSGRGWYRAAREQRSRAVAVGLPVRSVVDRRWVIPIHLRIDEGDGAFGGIVTVGLDTANLLRSFRALESSRDFAIALLRDDGAFLASDPDYEARAGSRMAAADFARLGGAEGTLEAAWTPESAPRISSFRKVAGHPMYVAVGLPTAELQAAWERSTAERVARGALITLLAGAFAAVLLRRVRREEAIALSLQHFRRAVETSADMVFWVARTGHLVYANRAACDRLGYDQASLSRLTVADISPEYDQAGWNDFWATLERCGQSRFSTSVRTGGGDQFPIGVAASRVVIGDEAYVFSICRDLTDERRIQASIESLNATLEQRVRERTEELRAANEELEAFTSSVSHDLRAPVRAVEGFADLLVAEAGPRLEGHAAHLLLRLRGAAGRMGALIEGLLVLSRAARVPLRRVPVDLGAIAREIVSELASQAPERRVRAVIADGLACHGDPVLLRQLMENLLGNAWKYSALEPETRIEVGARGVAGGREFFVRDNGAGFDPAYAHKLFKPFERLHGESEFPGVGIGLATVHRIVARHGGHIRAEGTPGQGAAFCFTLPQ